MAFGNKSNQEVMSEINVTPLVDVMLVLLVVFIVTAPLLTQSVRVNLPKTVTAEPSPQDHLANISVDARGKLFLDSLSMEPKELGQQLADRLARDPELIVQFNADDQVNYGRIAEVMALARQAGISRLSFLTKEESQ
ncbi:MAG: ExbD/TolR family protein [Methylococcaceae bacterium]